MREQSLPILEQRLNEFDMATQKLKDVNCGTCEKPNNCDRLKECKDAILNANLSCVRYHNSLHYIQEESGGVPKEQVDKYKKDIISCLRVMRNMNSESLGIWGIMQQMRVRLDLVNSFYTY